MPAKPHFQSGPRTRKPKPPQPPPPPTPITTTATSRNDVGRQQDADVPDQARVQATVRHWRPTYHIGSASGDCSCTGGHAATPPLDGRVKVYEVAKYLEARRVWTKLARARGGGDGGCGGASAAVVAVVVYIVLRAMVVVTVVVVVVTGVEWEWGLEFSSGRWNRRRPPHFTEHKPPPNAPRTMNGERRTATGHHQATTHHHRPPPQDICE